MFSTTWCGHCRRLKRQLAEEGVSFVEVDLDEDPTHDRRIIDASGGYRTVPTIEIGDRLLVNPTAREVLAALG
jgi:mycoredoxin